MHAMLARSLVSTLPETQPPPQGLPLLLGPSALCQDCCWHPRSQKSRRLDAGACDAAGFTRETMCTACSTKCQGHAHAMYTGRSRPEGAKPRPPSRASPQQLLLISLQTPCQEVAVPVAAPVIPAVIVRAAVPCDANRSLRARRDVCSALVQAISR